MIFLKPGHWHVYKQANIILWSSFGHLFLAPLYHILFPAGHAVKKPRLIMMETFFTYLTLSYPTWKGQLHEALTDHSVMPIMKSFLMQLRDLMEWFIPTVQQHI